MFAMHRKIEELGQESMRFFLLLFLPFYYVGVHKVNMVFNVHRNHKAY